LQFVAAREKLSLQRTARRSVTIINVIIIIIIIIIMLAAWLSWLGHRSLAGRLSLIYA